MILVPLLVAALVLAVAGARQRRHGRRQTLAPSTPLGRVAVGSLALMLVVALADASLLVTIPVGGVMLALTAWAWWGKRDHGLLLTLPLVFGVWTLAIPPLFE